MRQYKVFKLHKIDIPTYYVSQKTNVSFFDWIIKEDLSIRHSGLRPPFDKCISAEAAFEKQSSLCSQANSPWMSLTDSSDRTTKLALKFLYYGKVQGRARFYPSPDAENIVKKVLLGDNVSPLNDPSFPVE